MTPRPVILPSATDNWSTPQYLFDEYNAQFHFTLDAAASLTNAKCQRWFSKEVNGLAQDWGTETVWLNPPYGLVLRDWMRKAYENSLQGATVVCLVPARTDTQWWHRYAMRGEIRFLEGRLKFGNAKNAAPFASVVVVFRPPARSAQAA